VTLVCLLVLLANDWLAKSSPAVPGWLSGKVSDVAGLVAAPLCATAVADCALWLVARIGPGRGRVLDFSLGRGRLFAAVFACAAAFAAVKLSPSCADGLERAVGWIGLNWRVVSDPTDLWALPGAAIGLWLGRGEIARVPLGRLEVLEARWRTSQRPPGPGLADVVRSGGDRAAVAALADALESHFRGGPAAPVEVALARLRRRS